MSTKAVCPDDETPLVKVTALIAEDEAPQRQALRQLLASLWPDLEVVANAQRQQQPVAAGRRDWARQRPAGHVGARVIEAVGVGKPFSDGPQILPVPTAIGLSDCSGALASTMCVASVMLATFV